MDNKELNKYIENLIRTNKFPTKEDLHKYLIELRKRNIALIITDEDIKKMLQLYDVMHMQKEIPLDMKDYTNKTLDNKNFVVSEQDDRILKTDGNSTEFIKEFKDTQNEILAHSQDGNINARETFRKMADVKKEEITLIPLHEVITSPTVDSELLQKIKFFVTKSKLNPYSFKVNLKTGVFYNVETNELYEVRKNENTNQYEIFVSGEIRYGDTVNQAGVSETLENDHNEELYQQSKEKVKVRKLVPRRNPNNAAFAKVGLLLLNMVSLAIIGASLYVLLYNK